MIRTAMYLMYFGTLFGVASMVIIFITSFLGMIKGAGL